MKAAELREKSDSELKEELLNLMKERFQLRMQLVGGQLGDNSVIRKNRREIARLKTILREKSQS